MELAISSDRNFAVTAHGIFGTIFGFEMWKFSEIGNPLRILEFSMTFSSNCDFRFSPNCQQFCITGQRIRTYLLNLETLERQDGEFVEIDKDGSFVATKKPSSKSQATSAPQLYHYRPEDAWIVDNNGTRLLWVPTNSRVRKWV